MNKNDYGPSEQTNYKQFPCTGISGQQQPNTKASTTITEHPAQKKFNIIQQKKATEVVSITHLTK